MNLPGFSAEFSLAKAYKPFRNAASDTDHAENSGVIPQYCHCFAVGTLQIGPTGAPFWGPPYHYYCYGIGCRSGFGGGVFGG
jgi:hypothetical protein